MDLTAKTFETLKNLVIFAQDRSVTSNLGNAPLVMTIQASVKANI